MSFPTSIFEPARLIGAVCDVGPASVRATVPLSESATPKTFLGDRLGQCRVGEFVVVRTERGGVLGRVTRVALAEKERLAVEPSLAEPEYLHPTAIIQLLATIDTDEQRLVRGVVTYPHLNDRVYSAPKSLLKWVATSTSGEQNKIAVYLDLGWVTTEESARVMVAPEKIFGRHCAILGTTGGGKSFSLARLVEQAARYPCKSIVLDAVGEYSFLGPSVTRVSLGGVDAAVCPAGFHLVSLPHRHLSIPDLFALFQPSGRSQGPILRQALYSLKLLNLDPNGDWGNVREGRLLSKAGKVKSSFYKAAKQHVADARKDDADFSVDVLGKQIDAECIRPLNHQEPSRFGAYDENAASYCVPLVNRIESIIHSRELACVFASGKLPSLVDELEAFFLDPTQRVMHVSMKDLAFGFNAREVVANSIARWLLTKARSGQFEQSAQPVVLFLDEAHQFLNKSVGDDETKVTLDAFELIAKEGRKYWLNLCMATQQPRDIPAGVLSQMGTLLVHRLINDRDREVVERACGEIDRSAAAFLPTLGPGEAALIGVDFSIPLTVQMAKPVQQPMSGSADYQSAWGGNLPE